MNHVIPEVIVSRARMDEDSNTGWSDSSPKWRSYVYLNDMYTLASLAVWYLSYNT